MPSRHLRTCLAPLNVLDVVVGEQPVVRHVPPISHLWLSTVPPSTSSVGVSTSRRPPPTPPNGGEVALRRHRPLLPLPYASPCNPVNAPAASSGSDESAPTASGS